jgi:hypothetical protein
VKNLSTGKVAAQRVYATPRGPQGPLLRDHGGIVFGMTRCPVGRRRPRVGAGTWTIASGLVSLALLVPTVRAAPSAELPVSQTNAATKVFHVAARPSRRATRAHVAIRVIGKVRPPAPHQEVLLQERRGGHWRLAARRRLSRRSTFGIPYRPRRPGGQLLRVVKPRFGGTRAGASRILHIVAMARRTVRSSGGRVQLDLGPVHVSAPKGAIGEGETLTIETAPPSGPHGFASTGATSLVGGPYMISTSQGEPSRPVSVRIAYDAGLLSEASEPLFLHGWPKIHDWVPEPTHESSGSHVATARLTSFSPLDVVDYTTWLAGTVSGNRTDLPGNCGEIPDWINGAWFPKDRNDALPSCISNRTDAGTLRINVVNNRGYAQLVRVEGATLDVDRSGPWSDSIDGIVAEGFARLSPTNGPRSFVLSPGASATIALDRPSGLVGEQPVSIQAAPRGGSAAAQLGWAVLSELDRVKDKIGNVRDVTNCLIGAINFETPEEVQGATAVRALRSCLSGAAGISGIGKAILRKISTAILATDVFQKVVDLTLGETFPAKITFSFKGLPSTSREIRLENLDLGAIPTGKVTDWHIAATGGTAPYVYGISTIPANEGRAPAWAVLSSDGTLSVLPPDGTAGSYGFYVFATDALGQRSATGVYEVAFTVEGEGAPPPPEPCTDPPRTEQVDIGYDGEAPDDEYLPWADVSRDGCRIAFVSSATNLTAEGEGPVDGYEDVFMRDLRTGTTTQISKPVSDVPSSCWGDVRSPAISGNGRYVAFQTCRDNLVAPVGEAHEYIYIRDTVTGSIEPITLSSGAVPDRAYEPRLSETGRYVGFSTETPLVPGDTNGKLDAYLVDRDTGAVELLSASPTNSGEAGSGFSVLTGLSADGRFALFDSSADTFDGGEPETDCPCAYYVRDRQLHTTAKVAEPDDLSCGFGGTMEMSDDGNVMVETCGGGLYLIRRNPASIQLIAQGEDPDFAVSPLPGHGCTLGGAGTPTASISPDGDYVLFTRTCAPFAGTDQAAELQRTRVVVHDVETNEEEEIGNLDDGGCDYGEFATLLFGGRMESEGASTILYGGCNGLFARVGSTRP